MLSIEYIFTGNFQWDKKYIFFVLEQKGAEFKGGKMSRFWILSDFWDTYIQLFLGEKFRIFMEIEHFRDLFPLY